MNNNSLNQNVEIKNINPTTNENLINVVQELGEAINCSIHPHDVTDIYRTRTKNPQRSAIIVSFASYSCKQNFIKCAKTNRREKPNENVVFVNNHLTPTNKHLLWLTKNKARECNWKYVWEGKILARKCESEEAINICTVSDIEKIHL